jgi:hypothetical protein
MDRSGIEWVGVIVVVLIFLDLLFVEVRRILREGKRIAKRLAGYAELPLLHQIATSERDLDRIVRAVDAMAALLDRAHAAFAVLRRYIPKGSSPG